MEIIDIRPNRFNHLSGFVLFAYFLFAVLDDDALCRVGGGHAIKGVGFAVCLCVSLDRGNRHLTILFHQGLKHTGPLPSLQGRERRTKTISSSV